MTEDQPTPPEEGSKTQREKLTVARDNAYRDLQQAMVQAIGPSLSIAHVDMTPGGKIMLHANPGNLSQALGQLILQVKQLEVAVNTLVDLIFAPDAPQTAEEFLKRQAACAETMTSMIRRSLLSQGAQRPGIIKPS